MLTNAAIYAAALLPQTTRLIQVSGPVTAFAGRTYNYTITAFGLVAGDSLNISVDDSNAGGPLSTLYISLDSNNPSANFTFSPRTAGDAIILFDNDSDLLDPAPLLVTVAPSATAVVILSAPAAGQSGIATDPFTIGLDAVCSVAVTLTPSDNGGGGSFAPASATIAANSTATVNFTYTGSSGGHKTISFTNDAGLTNPAALDVGIGLPPAITGVTIYRGQLTRKGHGGVPASQLFGANASSWAIVAGNGAGHWQIDATSGEITPNVDSLSGTAVVAVLSTGGYSLTIRATNVNGSTDAVLTIGIRANTFTVSKPGETYDSNTGLSNKYVRAGSVMSGKRIEVARATPWLQQDSYPSATNAALFFRGWGQAITSEFAAGTGAYADWVVIGNEDDANPATVRDLSIIGSSMLQIDRLKFRRDRDSGGSLASMIYARTDKSFGVITALRIRNCDIQGRTQNAAKSVQAISLGSGYSTNGPRNWPGQCTETGLSVGGISGIEVQDNYIAWVSNGVLLVNSMSSVVRRNTVRYFCSNSFFLGGNYNCGTAAAPLLFTDNLAISGMLDPTKIADHRDSFQFGSLFADRDWVYLQVLRNAYIQADGDGSVQGLFFNDVAYTGAAPTATWQRQKPASDPDGLLTASAWAKVQYLTGYVFRHITVENHLYIGVAPNGIIPDLGDDWVIRNCTIAAPCNLSLNAYLGTAIPFTDGKYYTVKVFEPAFKPPIYYAGTVGGNAGRIYSAPGAGRTLCAMTNSRFERNVGQAVLGGIYTAIDPVNLPGMTLPNLNVPVQSPPEDTSALGTARWQVRSNGVLAAQAPAYYGAYFASPNIAMAAIGTTTSAQWRSAFRPASASALFITPTIWAGAITPDGTTFAVPVADSVNLGGPAGGVTGVASNLTAAIHGSFTATVRVTPAASDGSFTPAYADLTPTAPAANFAYTPATAGWRTLTPANNASLTPVALAFTAALPNDTTMSAMVAARPALGAGLQTGVRFAAAAIAHPAASAAMTTGVTFAARPAAHPAASALLTRAVLFSAASAAHPALAAALQPGAGFSAAAAAHPGLAAILAAGGSLSAAMTASPAVAAQLQSGATFTTAMAASPLIAVTLFTGAVLTAAAAAHPGLAAGFRAGAQFEADLASHPALTAPLTTLTLLAAPLVAAPAMGADLTVSRPLSAAMAASPAMIAGLTTPILLDAAPAAHPDAGAALATAKALSATLRAHPALAALLSTGLPDDPAPADGPRANQDEPLDSLVWRITGKGSGTVESVLDANPGLADLGPWLPAGLPVDFPAAAVAAAAPVLDLVQLWD